MYRSPRCAATTTAGTTITLTANCATTQALTVPDGFTLNGGGFTISASNPPAPAHTYTGAVVTNAAGATTMNIENLTITGPATGFPFPLPAPSCNTPLSRVVRDLLQRRERLGEQRQSPEHLPNEHRTWFPSLRTRVTAFEPTA